MDLGGSLMGGRPSMRMYAERPRPGSANPFPFSNSERSGRAIGGAFGISEKMAA